MSQTVVCIWPANAPAVVQVRGIAARIRQQMRLLISI